MTEQEKKLLKRVQIVVASAVAAFCVLVAVLVVTAAVRIQHDSMVRALQQTQTLLLQQINAEGGQIDHLLSYKFIEEWALKEGFGREGAGIFQSR